MDWIGLDWVGLDLAKWTHVQLWSPAMSQFDRAHTISYSPFLDKNSSGDEIANVNFCTTTP